MSQIYDDNIPKHRKKKESNTSKSSEKANHKHIYKECFISYPLQVFDKTKTIISLGSYCEICGISIFSTVNYEEFKDLLPLFELENPYEKYIDMKLKTNS